MRWWNFLSGIKAGIEEGVDQCRLSQPRFTCLQVETAIKDQVLLLPIKPHPVSQLTDNHACKSKAFPYTLSVDLIGQVGETDIAHQLLAG